MQWTRDWQAWLGYSKNAANRNVASTACPSRDKEPHGESEATTKQIKYARAPRELEDDRALAEHVPAMQAAAQAAFRVWKLRVL